MYRVILSFLLIASLLISSIFPACSPCGLILPSDTADEIKNAIGYAIAPTYLPRGFKFTDVHIEYIPIPPPPTDAPLMSSNIFVTYSSNGYETGLLFVGYPTISNDWPPSFNTIPGLETPEDAISEITINNRTAYLIRGRWTVEAVGVFAATGEAPDDAGWDYDMVTILHFALELRDGEIVGVQIIAGPNPAEWISSDELAKIAKYVVVTY